MIDWTKLTGDPVDPSVRRTLREWLLACRHDLPNNNYDAFLVSKVKGKSVLDIGICEHTLGRMNSPKCKHRLIKDNAAQCVGVDIISDLVERLVKDGFDVVCEDATSDAYLGQTFDVVHIGDVIEHVSDPTRLLKFAKCHLVSGGGILVRTPNPHYFNYQFHAHRDGVSVENLEHISYIVPFHALELSRRTRLQFSGSWTMAPSRFSLIEIKRMLVNLVRFRLRHAFKEIFGKPNTYQLLSYMLSPKAISNRGDEVTYAR